jgi:hypothetical protein
MTLALRTDRRLLRAGFRSTRYAGRYGAEVMSAMQLKVSFAVAEAYGKGRAPDGKARRYRT